jgi:hypothetical protein
VHLDSRVFIRHHRDSTVNPLAPNVPRPIRAVRACKWKYSSSVNPNPNPTLQNRNQNDGQSRSLLNRYHSPLSNSVLMKMMSTEESCGGSLAHRRTLIYRSDMSCLEVHNTSLRAQVCTLMIKPKGLILILHDSHILNIYRQKRKTPHLFLISSIATPITATSTSHTSSAASNYNTFSQTGTPKPTQQEPQPPNPASADTTAPAPSCAHTASPSHKHR